MAKQIGAVHQMREDQINVECLSDLNNLEAAQKTAEHFAAISNEYLPVDNSQLPCYLPALPPPTVEEHNVYLRLSRLKKTKSTLPIVFP